jgi:hypothetical protein
MVVMGTPFAAAWNVPNRDIERCATIVIPKDNLNSETADG